MCRHDFFRIAPPDANHGFANDFEARAYENYLQDPKFRDRAIDQWENLRSVFAAHADIILVPSQEGLHDQVFVADGSLSISHQGKIVTLMSCFSNAGRNPEIALQKQILHGLNDNREFFQVKRALEGTGDNVYDPARDCFWSGYIDNPGLHNTEHGRSAKIAHNYLSAVTGVHVVSLKTQKPFYHIDTVLAPLSGGHILVHEAGLSSESLAILKREAFEKFNLNPDDYLISVSEKDAMRFAINLRCFGKNIVMPECSDALKDTLTAHGYTVTTVDVRCFMMAGGAVHCLSNAIDEPRVKGGIFQPLEYRA